ncbi:RDD family protein [Nitrospirillum sp. BR 11828]|uniref:RDD family protein n=1 Tax=Nitrospirillum sp. BR 11828 TaxID=3104325 RepID=UPI002ACA9E61|nr:RDD family protein [Nitrospirillum sp. BR 11828]MDZ5645606.1 RDD family protein [Nitrospirillum sp. BR 11828]
MSGDAVTTEGNITAPAFAGFWRRLGAFAVDGLVLGIPGFTLGTLFFDQAAALGANGRLIGWGVAILYLGLLNSRIANGQTVGKRLLKLRVLGMDGAPLDLGTALVRAALLTGPWFLNGYGLAALSGDVATKVVGWALGLTTLGGNVTLIYLFLFNRPSRRSLHDLLCRSCVVSAASAILPSGPTTPSRRVWVGLAIPAIVLLQAPLAFYRFFSPALLATHAAAYDLPEVLSVSVMEQKMIVASASATNSSAEASEILTINARVKSLGSLQDRQRELARVAAVVLKAAPVAPTTRMVVSLNYGFDFGFASSFRGFSDNGTPAAWQDFITKMAPG